VIRPVVPFSGVVAAVLSRIDRVVGIVAALGIGGFAWPVLIGIGLGVGAYELATPEFAHAILKHRATMKFARPALEAVGVATLAIIVVASTVAFLRFRTGIVESRTTAYRDVLRVSAFLTGLPLVLALGEPLERDHEWLMLAFAVVASALVTYSFAGFPAVRRIAGERIAARTATACVLAGALAYFALAVRAAWAGYASMDVPPAVAEAVSMLRETLHGRLLHCSYCESDGGRAHFEPVLALLAPLYAALPSMRTLVIAQTCWLAAGTLPLFLLARRVLGASTPAALLGIAYLLHPAVQGANLAEFGVITLSVPGLILLVYFLESKGRRAYFATLALVLLIREDLVFAAAAVGLCAILEHDRERAALGFWTVVAALMYGLALRLVAGVSPLAILSEAMREAPRRYSKLPGAVAMSVQVFGEDKASYLARLLTPLLALPLVSRGRIVLVPGLLLALLATTRRFSSIQSPEVSTLLPFLFVLAVRGLSRVGGLAARHFPRECLTNALALGVAASSCLCSLKLGSVVRSLIPPDDASLTVSGDAVRTADWLRGLARELPRIAKVAAPASLAPYVGTTSVLLPLRDRANADFVIASARDRAVRRVLDAEEKHGLLERKEAFANVRLYATRYGHLGKELERLDDR